MPCVVAAAQALVFINHAPPLPLLSVTGGFTVPLLALALLPLAALVGGSRCQGTERQV